MQRRRLADSMHALVSPLMEARGFLVAIAERSGGRSRAPFDTLNLGLRTDDAPEHVEANRRQVIEALDIPPFAVARQVHGDRITEVGPQGAGTGFARGADPLGPSDALAVTHPGVSVGVLVADCVPVALASETESLLVLVHAGWRGMAAGIVSRAMGRFARPGHVVAAIGPAIRSCHYEVGEDVAGAVAAASDGAAVTARDGRRYLDLPETARRILLAAGVRAIDEAQECTACHPDRFFSHRRDGTTGRHAMVGMRL